MSAIFPAHNFVDNRVGLYYSPLVQSVWILLVALWTGHSCLFQVVLARRWTNVCIQQVQTNVSVIESQMHNSDDGHCLRFMTDEAFNGGGCLQLSTTQNGSRRVTTLVYHIRFYVYHIVCTHTLNQAHVLNSRVCCR